MIRRHRETQPPVDVCDFHVIGERKDDQGRLLLVGEDGRWYDYDIARGDIGPAELNDSWAIDTSVYWPWRFGVGRPRAVAQR